MPRLMSASPTAALAVRLSRVIRTAAPLQDTLVFTQRRQQYTGVFRWGHDHGSDSHVLATPN